MKVSMFFSQRQVSRKMDLYLSLCWFYMVSNVISERLNITGGSFQTDKYMDFSPLIIFDKVGPKQCIKYCMLHNGCSAVNFNRNDLYCELLNLINVNSQLLDITGIYFTEITEWTQNTHACWPNPCTGQTKCEAAYFNQYICVTYDTPCSSHPCNNGGTCRNQFESFLCSCPAGYHGAVCEYTPCTGQNCNYGSCVVSGSSFYCSCWSGYNGNSCQYIPCTETKCNNGEFVISGSSFHCSCWSGYYGDRCENTPCTGQNCNYGSCVVSGSSFYCSCWSGYNGNSCQYTQCTETKCNNGEFVISGSSFHCSCWSGYYGDRCENTPCTGQNCNYGSCVVSGSSFYCSCWSGYNGNSCQYSYTYINEGQIIMSPNYPSNYYDNAVISWSYRTDVGRRIVIVAMVIDLEENFDWLKVYHRPDKITLLASWTGTLYSQIVYSRDNYVYIEFTSDVSRTFMGFQIVVSPE